MLDTAAANQAIEWFSKQMQTAQPSTGGNGAGGVSEADLQARMANPLQRGTGPQADAYKAETTRLYKQFYGG
jgi:hypothetical protein